MKILKVS